MSPAPTPDEFSPAVFEQLRRLQARYAPDGQDLAAYLEGLYHAKYINYWDYIELDTLLSIQRPLTNIPDERIFIMYTRFRSSTSSSASASTNRLATSRSPRWAKWCCAWAASTGISRT